MSFLIIPRCGINNTKKHEYIFDILSNTAYNCSMIIESLAKAIKKSGKSRYRIAKDTGIDNAVLCRITTGSGTGSCSMETAEILCEYLGLQLVPKKRKGR